MNKAVCLLFSVCIVHAIAGCTDREAPHAESGKNESEVVTNRIAIPEVVRQNLGISFVKVERRRVAQTLRVPGAFEYRATARTEYRAPRAGRIELAVDRYDRVAKGELLYRQQTQEWSQLQQELIEAELTGSLAGSRLTAVNERIEAISHELAVLDERVVQLKELNEAGGGKASELAAVRGRIAQARSELAQAQEERAQAEAQNIRLKLNGEKRIPNIRFEQALRQASVWTGLDEDHLLAEVESEGKTVARWRAMNAIEVIAHADGVVDNVEVNTGAWVQESDRVLSVLDPQQLIFRAKGLQSDLGLLNDGQKALIVPPQGGSLDLQDAMETQIQIGVEADAHERVIDLLMVPTSLAKWARPGVSAHAEVVLDESAGEETAIPLSCVITDGMEKVFFLRDRKDPDQAVRVVADLGVDDGRWVVIRSGLKAGDEVVMGGAYGLKLTGAGKTQEGGHFHSDGTFHEAH